jgi:hypothetical protein
MFVKAAVFSGDERLLDEYRDLAQGYVDASHQLDSAHQPVVAIEDAAALIGLEGLDVAGRWTAVESARQQPRIGEVDR